MATKRPAKIASSKKSSGPAKVDPETGKPMVAVKVFRKTGGSGMHWVVLDEFDGSPRAEARMLPVR